MIHCCKPFGLNLSNVLCPDLGLFGWIMLGRTMFERTNQIVSLVSATVTWRGYLAPKSSFLDTGANQIVNHNQLGSATAAPFTSVRSFLSCRRQTDTTIDWLHCVLCQQSVITTDFLWHGQMRISLATLILIVTSLIMNLPLVVSSSFIEFLMVQGIRLK